MNVQRLLNQRETMKILHNNFLSLFGRQQYLWWNVGLLLIGQLKKLVSCEAYFFPTSRWDIPGTNYTNTSHFFFAWTRTRRFCFFWFFFLFFFVLITKSKKFLFSLWTANRCKTSPNLKIKLSKFSFITDIIIHKILLLKYPVKTNLILSRKCL